MTTQLISGGSDIGPENRPGASILELALKYSQTLRSYKERYCRMASCVLGVMNIEQPNPPNDVAEIDRVNAIYKARGDLASMVEARLLDKAEQVESSRDEHNHLSFIYEQAYVLRSMASLGVLTQIDEEKDFWRVELCGKEPEVMKWEELFGRYSQDSVTDHLKSRIAESGLAGVDVAGLSVHLREMYGIEFRTS